MQFLFRTAQTLTKQLLDTRAVLFDHSGTLLRATADGCVQVPVEPAPSAADALDGIRAAGIAVGVIGLGPAFRRMPALAADSPALSAGTSSTDFLRREVESILGPFDTWRCCDHLVGEGCPCRRQAPQLVRAAARDLGVDPYEVAVIGDTGPDLHAAQAAGAVGVLVPSSHTLRAELQQAPLVALGLSRAVDLVLGALSPAMPVGARLRY